MITCIIQENLTDATKKFDNIAKVIVNSEAGQMTILPFHCRLLTVVKSIVIFFNDSEKENLSIEFSSKVLLVENNIILIS